MECPRAHGSATARPTMRRYLRVGEPWFEALGTPADSRELIRGTRVTDAAAHRQPPSHARRGAPTSAARDVRPPSLATVREARRPDSTVTTHEDSRVANLPSPGDPTLNGDKHVRYCSCG
jgi:hypothetical protein